MSGIFQWPAILGRLGYLNTGWDKKENATSHFSPPPAVSAPGGPWVLMEISVPFSNSNAFEFWFTWRSQRKTHTHTHSKQSCVVHECIQIEKDGNRRAFVWWTTGGTELPEHSRSVGFRIWCFSFLKDIFCQILYAHPTPCTASTILCITASGELMADWWFIAKWLWIKVKTSSRIRTL